MQAAAVLVVAGVLLGAYLTPREDVPPKEVRAFPAPTIPWDGESTKDLTLSQAMDVLTRPEGYNQSNLLSVVQELYVRFGKAWRECVSRGELPVAARERLLTRIEELDSNSAVFVRGNPQVVDLAQQPSRRPLLPDHLQDLTDWTLVTISSYHVMEQKTAASSERSEEDNKALARMVEIGIEKIRAAISEGK